MNMANDVKSFESQEIFIRPMCIIQTTTQETFTYNVEVLEQIEKIDEPLVVVSIAGLYRTGKSYLMNRLAGVSEGFPLGSTIESKTKGIWAWCRKHPEIKDTVLLLLDTEGLGDVDKGDPGHDNRIFTLAVLLCNVLVYNMMTAFNQDAVDKLTFISEMSKNIRFANKTSTSQADDPLEMVLPTFVLCLRDFTLDLEKEGKAITADEYLEDSLKLKSGKGEDIERFNRPRASIKKYFPVRKCFTFDMPGNRQVIKQLEILGLDDLPKTFAEETRVFLRYVYQRKPKVLLHSKPVTGMMFVPLVKTYVDAIKHGAVPDVDDAISVVANIENERMAKVAVAEFRKLIEEVELPILQRERFETLHEAIQNKALAQFRLEAVFNSEKFEIKAIDEMDKIWQKIKNENLSLVEKHCKSVLEQIYSTSVEQKMQQKVYHTAGGHLQYKADIGAFKTAYRRNLKEADELVSQHVLNIFLEDESEKETEIMMADQKLTEEDRKKEADRMHQEHMKAQQQQQKLFEEKMREEKERAEQHTKMMEKEREEYRQIETQKLSLLTEQFKQQRELTEKQIAAMIEENKIIREENQRTIANMTEKFEKKERETEKMFNENQKLITDMAEKRERELKDRIEEERMRAAADAKRDKENREEKERLENKLKAQQERTTKLENRGLFSRVFNLTD